MKPLKLLGIPFDAHSSFLQGPALAPSRIRQTLHNGAGNYWTENTYNPIEHEHFTDIGNLVFKNYFDIKTKMAEVLSDGCRTLTMGGDHSITYPIMQAYKEVFGEFEILQIDAHGDLYDDYEGNKYSHACPFARIMEEDLACKLTQVGIRAFNPYQREQVTRFGIEVIEAKDFSKKWESLVFEKPL